MSRQFRDPYFNGRRAKRILVTVFLLHLAIIVLPLIFASLTEHFEPRIIVMNVGMADLPAGDNLDSEDIVVFNINGNLKGDEERYVFLGRVCYVGATAV